MLTLCYHDIDFNEKNPWVLHPATLAKHFEIVVKYPNDIQVTFDDNRLGCYSYAREILEHYGIKAQFYICINFVNSTKVPTGENYSEFMLWDHIKGLVTDGHKVGSHGVTHTRFNLLTPEQQIVELVESRIRIEEHTNSTCDSFASPYGYIDGTVCRNVKAAGYTTLASTVVGTSPVGTFMVKRWAVKSPAPVDMFQRNIESLLSKGTLV